MTSVITENSRKRTRLEANEAEDEQMNRAKRTPFVANRNQFANPQSFLPTTPKASFLRLHLQILKSLYVPDDNTQVILEEGTDVDFVKDDDKVQEDVFGAIELFVKQRRQLSGFVQAVKLNKAVQEEAEKCLYENETAAESYAATPMAVPSNDTVANGIFARGGGMSSQQSPYGQRLFSGSYRTGLSQSSHHSGSHLLTALLTRKYLIADRTLRKETHMFQELLGNVRERIGTIEALLAEQKESPGLQTPQEVVDRATENNPSPNSLPENEYRWEMIAKLETKRRLWTMLLKDMETAYDL